MNDFPSYYRKEKRQNFGAVSHPQGLTFRLDIIHIFKFISFNVRPSFILLQRKINFTVNINDILKIFYLSQIYLATQNFKSALATLYSRVFFSVLIFDVYMPQRWYSDIWTRMNVIRIRFAALGSICLSNMLGNTCILLENVRFTRASAPTRSTGPFPAVLRAPEVRPLPRLIISYAGCVTFSRKPILCIHSLNDELDTERNNSMK